MHQIIKLTIVRGTTRFALYEDLSISNVFNNPHTYNSLIPIQVDAHYFFLVSFKRDKRRDERSCYDCQNVLLLFKYSYPDEILQLLQLCCPGYSIHSKC